MTRFLSKVKIKWTKSVSIPSEDVGHGQPVILRDKKLAQKLQTFRMSSASLKILAQNSLSTFSHSYSTKVSTSGNTVRFWLQDLTFF